MPPSNFISILFSGGWVGSTIVLLLLLLSFTSLYLIIEQFLFLRRNVLVSREVRDRVRQLVDQGRISQAGEVCDNRSDTLSLVLGHALREADGGWTAVEKAAEDALAHEASRIGRRAEYLAVIGNLAPMVGLLGTVTGMIFAFQKVATTQGSAGAADLAEGIYQALVTTVCGLLVAIPSLGAYAVLRNRADTIVAEAAFAVAYVLSPLKRVATRRGATQRNPPAVPPEVSQ